MQEILESIKPAINSSKLIKINSRAIDDFVNSLKDSDFEQSEFNSDTVISSNKQEDHIGYMIVYNTINFCYWGEPKWTIKYKNEYYDGCAGLTRALVSAINDSYPLLDPNYLADLPEKDLANILKGNIEIPLFQERLLLLRSLGKSMKKNFNNSWIKVLEKGNYDAVDIVKTLVKYFPDVFKDEAEYNGHLVKFYKRAQLIPAYVAHDITKLGLTEIKISNVDKITAFADYKVPQILRKLGIIKYADELSSKVDNLIELSAGSNEEIEIRAFTIKAIDEMTRKAKIKFKQANAANIDGIIWFKGQVKSSDDKPYHRTKTIWY